MSDPRFRIILHPRRVLSGLLALLVAGCGAGGGTVAPIPAPPAPAPAPAPTPAPTPTPTPTPGPTNFDTAEYRRSDGPEQHGAITAWQAGASGAGVTVGVIDSGFDQDSPELAGRFHPLSTDVTGSGRGYDEVDSDGHGTNVVQFLLGARNDRATMGMAWGATLLALRADRPGSCTTTGSADESGCRFEDRYIAAGVDRAMTAGARVINISLGGSSPSLVLREAVARATAAGVIVVVSAGNEGKSTAAGDDPDNPDPLAQGLQSVGNGLVIIAGSHNEAGAFSAFSNRAGDFAASFLSALGERVCCDFENGDFRREVRDDGTFVFLLNGTSFAAPQVAGAAALLADAFPNLTGRQIVNLLLESARDAGAAGADPIYGRGILDIARAFAPRGATSLAGTAVPVDLAAGIGTLSGAMGDAAGRVGADAVLVDGYGRAYRADLSRLVSDPLPRRRLEPALTGYARTFVAGDERFSLRYSLRPGGVFQAAAPFDGQDTARARALAASVAVRIDPQSRLALGFAGDAAGLLARPTDGRASFLVADDAESLRLIGLAPQVGGAFARRIGEAAHLGIAWDAGLLRPDHRGGTWLEQRLRVDDPRFQRLTATLDWGRGPVDLGLAAGWLAEEETLLGARFATGFGGGADSLLLDARARLHPARGWTLGAAWREGWSWTRAGGLLRNGPAMRSRAWALDVERRGALTAGDRLALRLSQPLRVRRGGVTYLLPVGYDALSGAVTQGPVLLSLAPTGQELALEGAWHVPLGPAALTLNGYWRRQPGHIAAADDDLGAAVRLWLGF